MKNQRSWLLLWTLTCSTNRPSRRTCPVWRTSSSSSSPSKLPSGEYSHHPIWRQHQSATGWISFLPFFFDREKHFEKKTNHLIHSFMMATADTSTPAENVVLIQLMEQETIRVAKARGFNGVFTTNTNELTRVSILRCSFFSPSIFCRLHASLLSSKCATMCWTIEYCTSAKWTSMSLPMDRVRLPKLPIHRSRQSQSNISTDISVDFSSSLSFRKLS